MGKIDGTLTTEEAVDRIRRGWRGDINNDGKEDVLKHRSECREIDGAFLVMRGNYVAKFGGTNPDEEAQFELLLPTGNEYIYRGNSPNIRFFSPDRSASFFPGQHVKDKTSGKIEKIDGFVVAIYEGAPMGPAEAQLKNGQRRGLDNLEPIPKVIDGILRFLGL